MMAWVASLRGSLPLEAMGRITSLQSTASTNLVELQTATLAEKTKSPRKPSGLCHLQAANESVQSLNDERLSG